MISICSKSFQLNLKCFNTLLSNNKYYLNQYRNNNRQNSNYQNYRKDLGGQRKLFKTTQHHDRRNQNILDKVQQSNQTNIEEFVKNINQINREFLGIKVNTDYFKVYNQKKFEQICKPDKSQLYKINDLPFSIHSTSKQAVQQTQQKTLQKTSLTSVPDTNAIKMLKKLISQQKLTKQLQRLVQNYFSDLVKSQRNSRMEQNFEIYARKVVETLKASKWKFNLRDSKELPNIAIKNVTISKGVKVNRNDNYTVDSYKINTDEQAEGIITYTLWKKVREEYPESEWLAQQSINARIQAEVTNCPIVQVVEESHVQNSNKGAIHSFVFEANLILPPALSVLSLSAQEHLNSYRLKPENIFITNVDNKNIWFKIAYKQEEKKFKLVNKII